MEALNKLLNPVLKAQPTTRRASDAQPAAADGQDAFPAAPERTPDADASSLKDAKSPSRLALPNRDKPESYQVSQLKSPLNPNEDAPDQNGNCGPTSVVMAAMAFNRLDGLQPAQYNDEIERAREAGGRDPENETNNAAMSFGQLEQAARHYGLETERNAHPSIDDIKAATDAGKLALVAVSPKDGYRPESKSTGHYVLVTDVRDGVVHFNDPGTRQKGERTAPVEAFMKSVDAKYTIGGSQGMLVVSGPPGDTPGVATPLSEQARKALRSGVGLI